MITERSSTRRIMWVSYGIGDHPDLEPSVSAGRAPPTGLEPVTLRLLVRVPFRRPCARGLPARCSGPDPGAQGLVIFGLWRRWVRPVWRRPVPAVRTAMARALRLPATTTRRLARVMAV